MAREVRERTRAGRAPRGSSAPHRGDARSRRPAGLIGATESRACRARRPRSTCRRRPAPRPAPRSPRARSGSSGSRAGTAAITGASARACEVGRHGDPHHAPGARARHRAPPRSPRRAPRAPRARALEVRAGRPRSAPRGAWCARAGLHAERSSSFATLRRSPRRWGQAEHGRRRGEPTGFDDAKECRSAVEVHVFVLSTIMRCRYRRLVPRWQ